MAGVEIEEGWWICDPFCKKSSIGLLETDFCAHFPQPPRLISLERIKIARAVP